MRGKEAAGGRRPSHPPPASSRLRYIATWRAQARRWRRLRDSISLALRQNARATACWTSTIDMQPGRSFIATVLLSCTHLSLKSSRAINGDSPIVGAIQRLLVRGGHANCVFVGAGRRLGRLRRARNALRAESTIGRGRIVGGCTHGLKVRAGELCASGETAHKNGSVSGSDNNSHKLVIPQWENDVNYSRRRRGPPPPAPDHAAVRIGGGSRARRRGLGQRYLQVGLGAWAAEHDQFGKPGPIRAWLDRVACDRP